MIFKSHCWEKNQIIWFGKNSYEPDYHAYVLREVKGLSLRAYNQSVRIQEGTP